MATYSAARIRELVATSQDKSLSTTERGMAFQKLFAYLLEKVPGIRTKSNTLDPFHSEEIDLAVANTRPSNGLACLPHLFLVECKDWDVPVDSPNVAVFINKLTNRHVELGILVAANGVTGDIGSNRAAQHIVGMAQGRGVRVIVVSLADMCTVSTTQQFVDLMVDRLLELVASNAY